MVFAFSVLAGFEIKPDDHGIFKVDSWRVNIMCENGEEHDN
jgi:hypothetical protein